MAKDTPGAEARAIGQLLAEADAHFERAVRELDAAIGELQTRGADASKDVIEAVRALGKALTVAFEERARVERLRRQEGGGEDARAILDFASAREEVGRRLARLRAAAGD